MNSNPAKGPSCILNPVSNGGDYVAEGMAQMQQSTRGALTPVL